MEEAFRNCKERDESALIVYLTGGFPSFETSLGYLLACSEGGADIIEIRRPVQRSDGRRTGHPEGQR